MPKLLFSAVLLSVVSSSAMAQSPICKTDNPSCQGYTVFGPSAIDRCISVRGPTNTDFCEKQGETQRVLIHAGAKYCAVQGSEPPPALCDLHAIVVTEPQ